MRRLWVNRAPDKYKWSSLWDDRAPYWQKVKYWSILTYILLYPVFAIIILIDDEFRLEFVSFMSEWDNALFAGALFIFGPPLFIIIAFFLGPD